MLEIPLFEWKDLNGKTMLIRVGEDIENNQKVTSVIGQDIETGNLYLLRTEVEKVK